MNQALWKLTALAGVVGIGLLFVLQKQGFDKITGTGFPTLNIPADNGEPGTTKEGNPKRDEAPLGGPESFDQSEPVAARDKLSDSTLSETLTSAVDTLAGLTQREPAPTPIRSVAPSRLPFRWEIVPRPHGRCPPHPRSSRTAIPCRPFPWNPRTATHPIQPRARSVEPEPVVVDDPFERPQAAPVRSEPVRPEPVRPSDVWNPRPAACRWSRSQCDRPPPRLSRLFARIHAPSGRSSLRQFRREFRRNGSGRSGLRQSSSGCPPPAATELPLEIEPVERPRVVLPDPALDPRPRARHSTIGQEPPVGQEPAGGLEPVPLTPRTTPSRRTHPL